MDIVILYHIMIRFPMSFLIHTNITLITVDDCTCFEEGNYYTTNVGDDCRSFLQRTAFLPEQKLACPDGLIFDVNVCVCDWTWRAKCPKTCEKEETAVITGEALIY